MKAYQSARAAGEAARKMGLAGGLTGSGQQCGPVRISASGWAYWTAHNAWGNEPYGTLLLPGGKQVDPLSEEGCRLLGY